MEEFKKQSMSTPLEKASTVEEVCKAIQFIISVEGMTGQMIALDGGAHLSWKYEDFKE